MEEFKIVIENKKNNGIKCEVNGKNTDSERIASILLKTFINFCKATEIDVEELLDNESKD